MQNALNNGQTNNLRHNLFKPFSKFTKTHKEETTASATMASKLGLHFSSKFEPLKNKP
jgi:hypothetical protein